ncbi:MAG: NAD(P)H-dependent oxidoreductase [Syntrophorhabdales bacterium]|jgi:multimeric flavodoxin WrbA
MKVLVLNSSPRGAGQSKTELMLNYLTRGMREAGAEVEVVALREKTIKNCIGCFTCWTRTPGVCVHQDDMTNDLFPKWLESDLVVYGTPLYNYGVTATMKAFWERTIPYLLPFFEIRDGRMFHPTRGKSPAVVVLSVAGMPDEGHFGPLSAHMKYTYASRGRKLVAEIYRPAAEMLPSPFLKEKANDVLEATAEAGRELVQSMEISPETMKRITQPLVDPQFFATMANVMWKTCIAEGVTPKEFDAKKMIPRPDSIDSFLLLFPFGINAKAVGDRKTVVQFTFSGEVEGACYFTIEKGTVNAQKGTWDGADLTIETPFSVWMDIMTGKADGRQMLMEQKYRVSGDLPLMMQLFAKA